MKLLDVFEMAKGRKKGQRRMDLFRRENLETWILTFPSRRCSENAQPSFGPHLLRAHRAGNHEGS